MLKRLFVSSSSILKVNKYNNIRCYWVPPEKNGLYKISTIKQKYDIPKEIIELIESHEKELKIVSNQPTNEKKVIEKIHNNIEKIHNNIEKIHNNTNDIYNYINKIDNLQKCTLWFTIIIVLFKH